MDQVSPEVLLNGSVSMRSFLVLALATVVVWVRNMMDVCRANPESLSKSVKKFARLGVATVYMNDNNCTDVTAGPLDGAPLGCTDCNMSFPTYQK